jgi:hypothetical protein
MLKFLFSKNRKLFLATFLMTLLFATYKPIFSLLILFDSNYTRIVKLSATLYHKKLHTVFSSLSIFVV